MNIEVSRLVHLPLTPGIGSNSRVLWRTMICVLSLLLLTGCNPPSSPAQPGAARSLPQVDIVRVIEDEVREWDYFTGHTVPARQIELRAQVSGYLQRVEFQEGAIVEEGDLLFVIDQQPYRIALTRAQASLQRAKANYRLAEIETERAGRLLKTKTISQSTYDINIANQQVAEADVMLAQTTVQAAKLDIKYTEIRAPIRGRISARKVDPGNLVVGSSSSATLLAELVSIDPIYIMIDADERTVQKYIRLQQIGKRASARYQKIPAEAGLATDLDYPYRGMIDYVAPRVDNGTGTLRARLVIKNSDDSLVGGFFARVRVPGREPYRAALIPDRAIGEDQGRQFVYVINNQQVVEYRPITTGPMAKGLRIVRDGLSSGEHVVVAGLQRIKPGMKVKISQTQNSPAPENQKKG